MGSNNKFRWLQTPATTPQGRGLYPNLSQYAANRAQTVQREPNAVFSFQQFTNEPARNHPFAKPFCGLKPPTGVRIPPLLVLDEEIRKAISGAVRDVVTDAGAEINVLVSGVPPFFPVWEQSA